jgi:hypothetical protein
MATILAQLALVSESVKVPLSEQLLISAALQKQVQRDFGPIWDIQATVDAFASLDSVPPGYWPIIIRDDIGYQAAGIHLDQNGQPYALVDADYNVALTCSHECLEMLADPFGKRFVSGRSPVDNSQRVDFLLEVCDPSEAAAFGYTVNGLLLSDFYTPHYFDPVANSAVRYSFTDSIKAPRQVLKGGYLSWKIPGRDEWYQHDYLGGSLQLKGPYQWGMQGYQSWREVIDAQTATARHKLAQKAQKAQSRQADKARAAAPFGLSLTPLMLVSAPVQVAASEWATRLRADIDQVVAHAQAIK